VLERLFKKIFVAIVSKDNGYDVLSMVIKNKKVLFKEERHFEGTSFSNTMNRYIEEMVDASPYFYISTLNLLPNQGAYAGCSKLVPLHHEDVVGIQTLCRQKEWTQYASYDELYLLRQHYSSVGLDFIFSPFSMIEHYFADKIKNTLALYAFGMEDFFSVAIFDNGKLEYAHYFTTAHSNSLGISEEADSSMEFSHSASDEHLDDNSINLDDIEELEDLDLLDDLDSLGDIADLDSLDEVSEFSEDVLTPEELRIEKERNIDAIKSNLDASSAEYQRFEFIQTLLHRFYLSDECQNRFIETICIADGDNGGDELKRYLEEELFLNVLIRRVNVCEGINALAILEEEGL
jgi:hypothetical protein